MKHKRFYTTDIFNLNTYSYLTKTQRISFYSIYDNRFEYQRIDIDSAFTLNDHFDTEIRLLSMDYRSCMNFVLK